MTWVPLFLACRIAFPADRSPGWAGCGASGLSEQPDTAIRLDRIMHRQGNRVMAAAVCGKRVGESMEVAFTDPGGDGQPRQCSRTSLAPTRHMVRVTG